MPDNEYYIVLALIILSDRERFYRCKVMNSTSTLRANDLVADFGRGRAIREFILYWDNGPRLDRSFTSPEAAMRFAVEDHEANSLNSTPSPERVEIEIDLRGLTITPITNDQGEIVLQPLPPEVPLLGT